MDLSELLQKPTQVKKVLVDGEAILSTPQNTSSDILFESITMPHWSYFVTPNDIDDLYRTVTDKRLAGNYDKRMKRIKEIMGRRGFKFMAGGTNRNVFKHMEFPSIVAKVPIDQVGLNDNMAEYANQRKLWPYCAKMIQVVPTGVIGFAERVEPILNRYQFQAYSAMIYVLTIQLIGKYVLEDIGNSYFKNFGVRKGFGAVILDYPYCFELDGNKLMCNQVLENGMICGGEIDYDDGFNHLYCKRCGRSYDAAELQMSLKSEDIVFQPMKRGGKKPMLVKLVKGDTVIATNYDSDSIVRPNTKIDHTPKVNSNPKVRLMKGGVVLGGGDLGEEPEVKAIDPNTDVASMTLEIPSVEEEPKTEVKEEVTAEPEKTVVEESTKPEEPKDKPVEKQTVSQKEIDAEQISKVAAELKGIYSDPYSDPNAPKLEYNPNPPKMYTENTDTQEKEEEKSSVEINENINFIPADRENETADEVPQQPERIDDFPPNPWGGGRSISKKTKLNSNHGKNKEMRMRRPNNPYKN